MIYPYGKTVLTIIFGVFLFIAFWHTMESIPRLIQLEAPNANLGPEAISENTRNLVPLLLSIGKLWVWAVLALLVRGAIVGWFSGQAATQSRAIEQPIIPPLPPAA